MFQSVGMHVDFSGNNGFGLVFDDEWGVFGGFLLVVLYAQGRLVIFALSFLLPYPIFS